MYKPPRCEKCEYWREEKIARKGIRTGECRASFPSMNNGGYGCWSLTKSDDFCYMGAMIEEGNKQLLNEAKSPSHPDPPQKRVIQEDILKKPEGKIDVLQVYGSGEYRG